MKRKWFAMRRMFYSGALVIIGIWGILASGNLGTTVQTSAIVLAAAWRTGGNAILYLDGNLRQGVAFTVDLTQEPYPPDPASDKAFYTSARIAAQMGGSDVLHHYKILCGKTDTESTRVTTLVVWSQDYWTGTKQTINCGGNSTSQFEVEGDITLSPTHSFCMVTNHTPSSRRDRCLYGPRCDDTMKNGSETDVDCGGPTCAPCRVDRGCLVGSDCQSGSCVSGTCRSPTCYDGVKNQNETDVDCGGSCGDCSVGRHCNVNGDCASNYCSSGVCTVRPTCDGTPATSSAQTWNVLVEYPNSCANLLPELANSLSAAKQCASAQGATPISAACNYGVLIETNPNYTVGLWAASPSKAITCMRNTVCSNCSGTVTDTYQCVSQ